MPRSCTLQLDSSRLFQDILEHLRGQSNAPIILADRTTFKANATLLGLTCDKFQDLLESDSSEPTPVKGVSADTFSKVLELTHTGRTTFSDHNEVARFLEAAAYLGVRHIDTSLATLRKFVDEEVQERNEVEMELISEAATQLIETATPVSEAATDIEDGDEEEGAAATRPDIMQETNNLFKKISESLSMKQEEEDSRDACGDSGVDESGSVRSSRPDPATLAPIHAIPKRGFCGRFWQCRRCNYWCYTDNDIRKHEARFHNFEVEEEVEESASEGGREPERAVLRRLRRREREVAERRRRTSKNRELLPKGIKRGDHFRCMRCPYWCYTRAGMLLHERRHRCLN